jgi:LL-diaminopimelate aminotransferase
MLPLSFLSVTGAKEIGISIHSLSKAFNMLVGDNEKYSRRHDLLAAALNEIGFNAVKPKGSFFQYVEAPLGIKDNISFLTAEDFSQYIINNKLISTVPWDDAGRYIRFSITFTADIEQEIEIMNELKRRLTAVPFIWS